MLLVIDNFDSFTFNLVDYFERLGLQCIVYRNNVPTDTIFEGVYEGVVLSPGPDKPENAGNLLEIIHYYKYRLPILGICLGHQAIGLHFGASLKKASKPMHGKLSSIFLNKDKLFKGIPSKINVVRYHSLIVTHLPKSLINLSTTTENELMVMKHKDLPIYGIQYHPESILTEYGLVILNNWLIVTQIRKSSIFTS